MGNNILEVLEACRIYSPIYDAAADEIKRLRAEVARLKPDADRYVWLVKNCATDLAGDYEAPSPREVSIVWIAERSPGNTQTIDVLIDEDRAKTSEALKEQP